MPPKFSALGLVALSLLTLAEPALGVPADLAGLTALVTAGGSSLFVAILLWKNLPEKERQLSAEIEAFRRALAAEAESCRASHERALALFAEARRAADQEHREQMRELNQLYKNSIALTKESGEFPAVPPRAADSAKPGPRPKG